MPVIARQERRAGQYPIVQQARRVTSLNGDGLSIATIGQLTNATGTTASGAQGGVIGGPYSAICLAVPRRCKPAILSTTARSTRSQV